MFSKMITRLALGIGIVACTNVYAANFSTTSTINTTQCTALNNTVTIQLSDGVNAAYGCSATTVYAGTCHTNGSNRPQSVTCSYQVTVDSSNSVTVTKNSPGCPDWNGSGSAPVATDNFNGRLAFMGGSGGGSVGQANLNNRTCSGTTIDALVPLN